MTDREALVTLRVSVARIAEAAGVPLTDVGITEDAYAYARLRGGGAPYEVLRAAAESNHPGWNILAGRIVGALIDN
jgi:hypothetical protein